MGNQSKPTPENADSEVGNLCIICHHRLRIISSEESDNAISHEAQNFILQKIFLVRDSVFQQVTERINQCRVKRNVLFQLCKQCDFHMRVINGMLSSTNCDDLALTILVQHLQKQKCNALAGAERLSPVTSTSFDIPLSESSNITPEEVDVLRRVEHLRKGQVVVELERIPVKIYVPNNEIKMVPMPLSVKRARFRTLGEKKSFPTATVELPTASLISPSKPNPVSVYNEIKYSPKGEEIRKSERKKRTINYREDDLDSVLSFDSTPTNSVAKKSKIISNSRKMSSAIIAPIESQQEMKLSTLPTKNEDAFNKQGRNISNSFLKDLETYGTRMLNWSKLSILEQASASLEAQLKTCPGKYTKADHLEYGQVKKSVHKCDLCVKQFSNMCYLMYHIDRVHFGTAQPCKCPSCGCLIVSIKRGVEHVKLCFQKNPKAKDNGWSDNDESEVGARINDVHQSIDVQDSTTVVSVEPTSSMSRSSEIDDEEDHDSENGSVIMTEQVAVNEISANNQMENSEKSVYKEIYEKIEVAAEKDSKNLTAKMTDSGKTEEHTCSLCKAVFRNSKVHQFHIITQHNCPDLDNQFPVCKECKAICLDWESLRLHVAMFHP